MASIAKNFGYNILLNVSRVVFPLITAPYVSRVLEPDGIGLFGFSHTYVNYFVLVALLGIPTYGIREVAKSKSSKIEVGEIVSQLMSISFICTAIVSLCYIGSIFLIPKFEENYLIFLIAGTVLYLAPFQIDWFFQGIERFDFITVRSLIIRIISIVCIFIFVKTKEDLPLYVGISALGTVVGNVWNYVALYRYGIKVRLSLNKLSRHLKPLLILFSSSIAISIYVVLDTIMLGFMSDYSEVGYYTNASYISRTLLVLVTSLSAVAIPRISDFTKNGKTEEINLLIRKSFSIISFLAIPMTMGIVCLSSEFTILFFGTQYIGTIIPMAIMSGIIIAVGFNNLTGVQVLIGMGRDKPFLWSVILGAILNFLMNLFLIPKFGAIGASISSVTAEFVILGLSAYFVIKYTPVRITGIRGDIFKSMIGCILFYPVCHMLNNVIKGWEYLILASMISGIIYISTEILLKHGSVSLILSLVKSKIRK